MQTRIFILFLMLIPFIGRGQYSEMSAGLSNPGMEGGPTEFEIVDINMDGYLDIICVGDHGSPYINTSQHGILIWQGNGNFGWTVIQTGNFGYGGVAVGDVNNDGYLDVGYGMHHNYSSTDFGDQVLEVALGNGDMVSWTPWDDSLGMNGQDWGMFGTDFADINNDGWLDIGSISFGCCDGIHVHLNNQDGTWPQSFGFIGGNSDEIFQFGDINNDGFTDFAAAHQSGSVYFGDGSGNFVNGDMNLPSVSIIGRPGVSLGDVNNDGGMDLAFVNTGGGVEVWSFDTVLNQWGSLNGDLPVSGNYRITQIVDLNMDGFMDIAAFGNALLKTWLGNGNGNWTPYSENTTPASGYPKAFRAGGDVDRNGFPDLLIMSEEGSWISYNNYIHLFKENSPVTDLIVKPVYPRGHEVFREGSIWNIDWITAVPGAMQPVIKIEFSATGPNGPWTILADNLPNTNRYQCHVPVANSSQCYLKFTASGQSASSSAITSQPFTIIGTTTAAAEKPPFSLSARVVPNPSAEGAGLQFSLGKAARVSAGVYNMLGDKVMEIPAHDRAAGHHSIPLYTGESISGKPAPGLYLVRLLAGDTSVECKMLVK
ncbi:MAG TPA: VCBS repeat-containing protein [Bacteroidales bacterium]|nr:VCBS repeat-containing protein [Bacteroidales bacterium]HSA44554.1 VCBS repeat-containing protein [Bacteroidales bacterium]